jgi:D-tyrosyl-tRNA(Tyr) deacylase
VRLVIQRVRSASVDIAGTRHAEIGPGLLVLVGIEPSDTPADLEGLAQKTVNLRIFDDDAGVMNRSLADTGGGLLLVSQFTLFASTRKGNRPSYSAAARPEIAVPLYEAFQSRLVELLGRPVPTGVFGADMQVSLVNDGPVTLWIDSRTRE